MDEEINSGLIWDQLLETIVTQKRMLSQPPNSSSGWMKTAS
jgi:hypothetical protein